MDTGETTSRFRVEGMDCAGCGTKIETAIRRMPGVSDVQVSVVAGTMTVAHGPGNTPDAMVRTTSRLGYRATPLSGADEDQGRMAAPKGSGGGEVPWFRTAKARLTIACAIAVVLAFAAGQFVPEVESWAFLLAMAIGLVPIARRAVFGAINGSPFSIETLMSVAAIGAVFIGATEEAAIVVLLFLVGELLEGVATARARASIRGLVDLVPQTALREHGGTRIEIAARDLEVGDIAVVRPGDRVPADGEIVSGESDVDESPITGESVPRHKRAGEKAFAGTIALDGVLRLHVTAAAADNTIARIVTLVEQAQEAKAPTERFIDRFSKVYTPGVIVVAALVAVIPPLALGAVWSDWVYRGLAILLIGCPCALVISTPAAIAAALSAGARQGLLMKGGAVLETLGRIDTVALDKTGTLTKGMPSVTDILPAGASEAEILSLAAGLESGSNHPLAKAILARAQEAGVAAATLEALGATPGKGVFGRSEGRDVFLGALQEAAERGPCDADLERKVGELNAAGKTVSILVSDGTVLGAIAMRDELRADARSGVRAIEALGAQALMLTGDTPAVAHAIAEDLGIGVHAGLLPEDKQYIVARLQADGRRVAKVGDGINDAPALAVADIGIAMGGGTDVALETADAAVLHGRVGDVANMIGLSRATMANIAQNISIALGLKAVLLVTTILGITGLWPAILADTGATVLVTLNAMRLLGWRGRAGAQDGVDGALRRGDTSVAAG